MRKRLFLDPQSNNIFYKALLREKDINPLHPWDTSLPLFIADPRYALVPSVSARRDVFDEYCRERSRELRAAKVAQAKEEEPKAAFERLLREEVKSTRLTWSEWRKTWKKDRRFQNWGRDDREREKRFREYIRELGESKPIHLHYLTRILNPLPSQKSKCPKGRGQFLRTAEGKYLHQTRFRMERGATLVPCTRLH